MIVPARLLSLDAFRGLTVALMVLVNTAGMFPDSYSQLRHATWDGWTLTDTVFPSFVWIVGLSVTLSRRSLTVATILRRGAILFALGLFLYGFPTFDLTTWRILGVLQRIAICYIAAALLYRSTGARTQTMIAAALLGLWWLLMGPGPYEPGKNFAATIDYAVLGAHNYQSTKTWDPEGLVSTLPAIATALIGVLAGQILRRNADLEHKLLRFFTTGSLLMLSGIAASGFTPINKLLWTPSFTLWMAGLDFTAFAVLAFLIDGERRLTGVAKPFAALGSNAIVVYMVSEIGETLLTISGWRMHLYKTVFTPLLPPVHATFAYSLLYTGLMLLLAWLLYRRGCFVRI